jgi:hypothetical protein
VSEDPGASTESGRVSGIVVRTRPTPEAAPRSGRSSTPDGRVSSPGIRDLAWRTRTWNVGQDAILVFAFAAALLLRPADLLTLALAVASPLILAWGIVTLHFPNRVEVTSQGISFAGYGRTHRFAWTDIEHLHVRRFALKGRVLVRVSPAPTLRGRYWITDAMEDYERLVAALETRARRVALARTAILAPPPRSERRGAR